MENLNSTLITSYERDKESGLDYAQARYYNSNHGRFTSVDPLTASASIRNPQTFNRYSYVLNSPYKFTDPLGLLPEGRRGSDGGCSAEYSSCSDEMPDPWEGKEEVPEQQETEEGVADNQNSASESPQQEAKEAVSPPQIEAKSARVVVRRPKHNENGEIVGFEEITLANGEIPKDFSTSDFEINLNDATNSLLLGEDVYIVVEFGIQEVGNQDRASFDGATTSKQVTSSKQDPVSDTVITNNGNTMTVYVGISLIDGGLAKGKNITSLAVRAQASYFDEYDSTSNQIAVPRKIQRNIKITLHNSSTYDPATIFLKKQN